MVPPISRSACASVAFRISSAAMVLMAITGAWESRVTVWLALAVLPLTLVTLTPICSRLSVSKSIADDGTVTRQEPSA
ncbi:hypothetical protein CISEMA079M_15385 [Citrobacter sedlakii]